MTNVILKASGSVFDVPMDLDLHILGGPFSLLLKTRDAISIDKVWKAFSDQLNALVGLSLPTIPKGPWSLIMEKEIIPSLWISPDRRTGNVGALLQLAFAEELQLGTHYSVGGIDIDIEPQITIVGLLIGYDAEGDGLTVKAKIKTTVKNSVNAKPANKEQLVNFPFPLPAQNAKSAFRLEYLGVGQRIGPTVQTIGDENPLEKIFAQLESQLHGDDPEAIITQLAKTFYHPDRDWFIAADMRLRELRLRLLFNDPVMYGLEISIPPTTPPTFFSGLLFEILYQKLGPNLGVYYGALTLPYGMRRIPLEGFILILPGFSAWIYTNGDFRINVGWPVTPNNAIGISLDILTGWAGFYFSKLRSGNNPSALPCVSYNPILEFGIGIAVSASISLKAGPLSATLSASLSASFQGLLAWKGDEKSGSLSSPPDHYWFAGTASIAVVLQGCVDLCILKASVMISVSLSVGIAFEKGYQTVIPVSASVSVRISVEILFFTIHLSFNTTIHHTFYVGRGTPASINGPLAPGLRLPAKNNAWMPLFDDIKAQAQRLREQQANSTINSYPFRTPARFHMFTSNATPTASANSDEYIVIPVYFTLQPTVVYKNGKGVVNVIATLLMNCPAPSDKPSNTDPATDYKELMFRLIKWLYDLVDKKGEPLSDTLQRLSSMLGSGRERPQMESGDKDAFARALKHFFSQTFRFELHGVNADSNKNISQSSVAMLPMFDELRLEINNQFFDFAEFNRTPENYADLLALYFANVGLVGEAIPAPLSNNGANKVAFSGPSMASYIFEDYFLLIARHTVSTLLQDARQYEAEKDAWLKQKISQAAADRDKILQDYCAAIAPDNELDYLLNHLAWWSIAGFGSRYLLSGLQLPDFTDPQSVLTPDNIATQPTRALYQLSGQQHALPESSERKATLRFAEGKKVNWITFAASNTAHDEATATILLTGDIPDMPNPRWITQHDYAIPASQNVNTLMLQPLSPVTATPLKYPLKNHQTWRKPDQLCTLYPLPDPLRARTEPQQPLQLNFWRIEEHNETSREAISGCPVLQINLSLSRVTPGLDAGGDEENEESAAGIYLLSGTSETTREQIFQALQTDLSTARLHFLYLPPGETEWVSDEVDDRTLLAKLNLSTLNQIEPFLNANQLPDNEDEAITPEFAPVGDVKNFLRLLWELSVVRAPGYYLHYRNAQGHGLPTSLFADTSNTAKHNPVQSVIPGTSSGTANLTIVVEFAPFVCQPSSDPDVCKGLQLERYHNSLWIKLNNDNDALVCEVLDSRGVPVNDWHSTSTPGCIGFNATWTPRNSTTSQLPTDQLYHLMQYQIEKNKDFNPSVWSLPVGPEGGQSDKVWQLRQNVSLLPFINSGNDVEELSPYSITGREITLGFRLCDIYGNALSKQHSQSFTPAYSDPLIAPGEWPGLHISYYFAPKDEQEAQINVVVEFTPNISSEAVSAESDATAPWRAMRQKYQRILDQLNDAHTQYTFHCSLAGDDALETATAPLRLALKGFVLRIINYIDEQIRQHAGSSANVDENYLLADRFSLSLPFTRIKEQRQNILPVSVSIHIQRDPHLIDKEVVDKIPAVASLVYVLPAKFDLPGAQNNGGDSHIRTFALNFEQAFIGLNEQGDVLKLAQRAGNQSPDTPDAQPDLWSVRFGAQQGVRADFRNNPVCFALRPLSPQPRSGEVDGIHYRNIDLDEWASSFLSTFDLFMSPQNGVAIALLDKRHDTRYFDQLMACKQQIAKAIPTVLEPVLQKDAGLGDLPAAQARLRQALQQNLAQAYTISTVVQLPARVTIDGQTACDESGDKAPQFYGSLVQPAQDDNAATRLYQLSPTTLDLSAGRQWATSLLTVTRPGEQSCIQLPLEYHVGYLQHEFASGYADDDYTPSSWLKFVLPGNGPLVLPVSENEVTVFPLPMPFKPTPPVLMAQRGSAVAVEVKDAKTPGDAIKQALFWRYQVQASAPIASQDTLYIDLIKNASVNNPPCNAVQRNGATLEDLFISLARFQSAMPDITSRMIEIQHAAAHEEASDDVAIALVRQFYDLSHAIAESWPVNEDHDRLFDNALQEIDHFCLTFTAIGDKYQLQLRGRCDGSNANPARWPALPAQDWHPDRQQAEWDGEWWRIVQSFDHRPDLSTLELDWHPLGMLEYQSARMSSWVVRNAELVPAQATNPLFIYQTEETGFADALIPFIEHDDLPAIAAGKFNKANLDALMKDIFSTLVGLSPSGIDPVISFQVNCSWPLGNSPLRATSPILLINALAINSNTAENTATDVAKQIEEWYQKNLSQTARAQLEFTLTLFGTIRGQQLPLVKINKIPVKFE
ncbi:TPA: hypothetical protein ACIPUI_000237 [Citrobacter freundii]